MTRATGRHVFSEGRAAAATAPHHGHKRGHDNRLWLGIGAMAMLIAAYAWAVDFFTIEGERTVYTVDCVEGQWAGQRCSSHLAAGKRVRFRALPAHGEVLFWTVGTSEPAGKLTNCQVDGGRNWTCPISADASRTITLRMVHGEPQADVARRTRDLHAVPKLRWWLLRLGVSLGADAEL